VEKIDWAYNLGMAVLILILAILLQVMAARAEEIHDHTKMGKAGQFYEKWMRPTGPYSGIKHRSVSCCNRTDCSPVIEMQRRSGQLYARFELQPNQWYPVPESVIESNQEDPRESPDDRAHGCIIGGQVACLVFGAGG